MSSLELLPVELLERILCSPELRADDVINCCLASPIFRYPCQGDNFWRMKLKCHYPNVIYKLQLERRIYQPKDFYIKLCRFYERMCSDIMALSNVFVWSLYQDYEWPDIPHRALELYMTMFDDELDPGVGRYYVLDECYNIIHRGQRHRNLTLKYYAQKVYFFVNCKTFFCEMWNPMDIRWSNNASNNESDQFDIYGSAYRLAVSIPMCQRIDEDAMLETLKILYSAVDDRIRQYRPDILSDKLRRSKDNSGGSSYTGRTIMYNNSECTFLLKQIHDCVRHDFKFKSVGSSVYKGYKYCLDKVLKSKVGDDKLIVTLEAHLAQHYGIYFSLHDDGQGNWKIFYKSDGGLNSYYICPTCDLLPAEPSSSSSLVTTEPKKQVITVLTDTLFHRRILESLVTNFESNLKKEWKLAGGPIVYNLLTKDTFTQSMRNVFSAWRHVEHWKIAQLRHYSMLLQKVSDDQALPGKILHLNILLRVKSNETLEILTNFRRELLHPPSGIRELQRMVASVNIRARARCQELRAMLANGNSGKNYFLATFHPSQIRPWPHGWPGSDMVQKRRLDRKSWHVQFAVGQIVEIHRGCAAASAASAQAAKYKSITSNTSNNAAMRSQPSGDLYRGRTYVRDRRSNTGAAGGSGVFIAKRMTTKDSQNNCARGGIDDDDDDDETNDIPIRNVPVNYTDLVEEDLSMDEDDNKNASEVKPRASGHCVVYDWDSMCVEREETLLIMGETNLTWGTDQPFYSVLLDDGSSSYVAQENLKHAEDPRPINNPLLGRYFRAYVRPYYIPNMQKAYEYPEDATIREQDSFILSLL